MKLEFSWQIFEKILKCQISQKSVQWEPSCPMRTDRLTDMTKLKVAFGAQKDSGSSHAGPVDSVD